MVESPFEFPKSPKDELYLQPLAMIEIDIEAVAGVEPHKEVQVAKLHEEADLVKAQNTVQVIVVGNQEEVAHPKDVAQEEEAHPKEEEEALLKELIVPPKEAVQEDIAEEAVAEEAEVEEAVVEEAVVLAEV